MVVGASVVVVVDDGVVTIVAVVVTGVVTVVMSTHAMMPTVTYAHDIHEESHSNELVPNRSAMRYDCLFMSPTVLRTQKRTKIVLIG